MTHATRVYAEGVYASENDGHDSEDPKRDHESRYDAEGGKEEEKYCDFTPFTKEAILQQVEVSQTQSKGNCLFVRKAFEPGDLIIIESPLFSIIPSLNEELWSILKALNEHEPFALPPLWHHAALTCIIEGTQDKWEIMKAKWVSDKNAEPSDDVIRVLQAICHVDENDKYIYGDSLEIEPRSYQYFLQVWQFNAFGHSTDPEGLVIYDGRPLPSISPCACTNDALVISYMSHSCDASCTWHHAENDTFVLRARRRLLPGDEITISYLGEADLLMPSYRRRELLNNWCFTCTCDRCATTMDAARGFLCKLCHHGCIFLYQDPLDISEVEAHACTMCGYNFTPSDVCEYLDLESAYIQRMDTINPADVEDILLVYDHARNVFKQHWVLYQLETLLFDWYKGKGNSTQAYLYLSERIQFVDLVMKRPMYCFAFMYEEMADLLASQAEVDLEALQIKNPNADVGTLNVIMYLYFKAATMLAILCGYSHSYYYVVVTKRNKIEEVAMAVMKEHETPESEA